MSCVLILPSLTGSGKNCPLPLEGRRLKEFMDVFFSHHSLSDGNKQGKETKGTRVAKQGGES